MGDLRGLLTRLAVAKFPFVVVGGYAAAAHGVTLVTQDLDVCCEFTEVSLHRLHIAIGDLHPVHRMRPDRMPLTMPPGFSRGLCNLYLDTDEGPLDLLGEVKGIGFYPDVVAQSMEVNVGRARIRVLSLDGIIAAKEAMNRARDREAVRQLNIIRDAGRKGNRGSPP